MGKKKNKAIKKMENINYRSFARRGVFLPSTHFEISLEAYIGYIQKIKEIRVLKSNGTVELGDLTLYKEHEIIDVLESDTNKEVIKAIIFLAAFIESYLFDYSAISIGQGFTKSYIEGLSTISKLNIIPRLISGKSMKTGLPFYGEIKNLIKLRNQFVHIKTRDFVPSSETIPEGYTAKQLYEEINLKKYFNAVFSLFEELDRVDPPHAHIPQISLVHENLKIKLNELGKADQLDFPFY